MKFYVSSDFPTILLGKSEKSGVILCIIGQVSDLITCNLVLPENTEGKESKWLLIDRLGAVNEYNSKEKAKAAARLRYDVIER